MPGDVGGIKAGSAYVAIGGDSSALEKALDRISKKFRTMSETFTAIGKDLSKLGATIIAPIAGAVKVYESMGESLFRASQRTGIAVSQLSALGYAAQQSGVEMESLENGMRKMQRTIGEAAGGSRQASEALAQIGLSVNDLQGLSPDQQFARIADAMKGMNDPTVAAAEAMKIFGRNGTQLLPLLDRGGAGINQLSDRAKALGIVLGDDSARGAAELHGRMVDLSDVLKNSFFRVGEAVAPMVQDWIEKITRAGIAINHWISDHKELIKTALKVGLAISAAGVAFLGLGIASSIAGKAISGIGAAFSVIRIVATAGVGMLTAAVGGLIAALGMILTPIGAVVAGLVGLGAYFVYATDAGRSMLKAMGTYFGNLLDVAKSAFGGIRDALAAGDWALAAKIAWEGLKLAWIQGIQPLTDLWANFKAEFVKIAVSAFYGVLEAWEKVKAALKISIATLKDFFKGLWQGFKDTVADAWDDMTDVPSGMRHALEKTEAGRKYLAENDKAKSEKKKQREQKSIDASGDSMRERDQAIAAAKTERDAAIAGYETDKDALKSAADKVAGEDIAKTKSDIDAAKKELADLVAKAHKEGGGKSLLDGLFSAFPALPSLPPEPKLRNEFDPDTMMPHIKSVGTFSAAGAFGLAGSGIPQRQLETANKSHQVLMKLLDATKKTADAMEKAMTLA